MPGHRTRRVPTGLARRRVSTISPRPASPRLPPPSLPIPPQPERQPTPRRRPHRPADPSGRFAPAPSPPSSVPATRRKPHRDCPSADSPCEGPLSSAKPTRSLPARPIYPVAEDNLPGRRSFPIRRWPSFAAANRPSRQNSTGSESRV